MTLLDGPRLPPKSGVARQLVVFLHGYGADGNDLIEIGRQWQGWLPDAAFVAPHAPEQKLGLVGFSQGTMMALHSGLRRTLAPAAIVGFSGTLVGSEHLAEATARTARGEPPPILLVHGDADLVRLAHPPRPRRRPA